jgi:ketosteroid isomerase-like protein
MNRRLALFAALLLCCPVLFAQNAASNTPTAVGVASTDNPEVAAIQKVEDEWGQAVDARDQYGIELVLSPLFVNVSATGDVTTRNQQVAQLINGDDKTIRLEQKVITVRVLGDVAVANGTYVLHHKGANGPVDEKGVFTQVFQQVHDRWLCINSQRTTVVESGVHTAKAKKKSDAEEPFHIPFFSK